MVICISRYVISDIHGCYDKYIKMLEKINFNNNDDLYILGDIFDRGEEPLKILDHIVANKNIYLIKGNHEEMFIEAYEHFDYSLWYLNGGKTTHSRLLERGQDYIDSVYKYIKNLPLYMVVDNYILVHADILIPNRYSKLKEILNITGENTMLWSRSNIGNEKEHIKYKVVHGHTPVMNIKENGHYYIDCGCCFPKYNGRLACLNLDTLDEYYI